MPGILWKDESMCEDNESFSLLFIVSMLEKSLRRVEEASGIDVMYCNYSRSQTMASKDYPRKAPSMDRTYSTGLSIWDIVGDHATS